MPGVSERCVLFGGSRMSCKHDEFRVDAAVFAIDDQLFVEMNAKCVDCSTRFRFKGVPHGVLGNGPTVNADGTELCVPIEQLAQRDIRLMD